MKEKKLKRVNDRKASRLIAKSNAHSVASESLQPRGAKALIVDTTKQCISEERRDRTMDKINKILIIKKSASHATTHTHRALNCKL